MLHEPSLAHELSAAAAHVTAMPAVAPQREQRLLGVRLQRELTSQALHGVPITYRRLSGLLSLAAPDGTTPLRTPLEALMEEDAFAGRPFIAALAVSAGGGGLPAPWFFRKAGLLGRFAAATGDAVEAFAFHARELQRAVAFYRRGEAGPGQAAPDVDRREDAMLRARDVMTTRIVSVPAASTVSEVADVLALQGVSAVPVLKDGRMVGIVSEGDLVRRAEIGTARPRSWWLNLFRNSATLAAEYTRRHSTRIADVMTREVETVAEDTPLATIADLLERKHIKRVPVMRSGRIVGIVSRANLVRAVAVAAHHRENPAGAGDLTIRDRIREALDREIWPSAGAVNFTVSGGIIAFWGTIQSEEERRASHVLCENVPGVRGIEDHRLLLDFPTVEV